MTSWCLPNEAHALGSAAAFEMGKEKEEAKRKTNVPDGSGGDKTMSVEEEKIAEQSKTPDFEVTGDEFVSGFALNGEYVKSMKDKSFTIIGQKTVLVPDIEHPETKKKKVVLTVKLADGTQIDYYPNKTSQRAIIAKRGFKLSAWIGFAGKLMTESQRVGAMMRDVIYIEAGQ